MTGRRGAPLAEPPPRPDHQIRPPPGDAPRPRRRRAIRRASAIAGALLALVIALGAWQALALRADLRRAQAELDAAMGLADRALDEDAPPGDTESTLRDAH